MEDLVESALNDRQSLLYDKMSSISMPTNWTKSECVKSGMNLDKDGSLMKLAKVAQLCKDLDRDQLFILLMRVLALMEHEEVKSGTKCQ